MKMEVEDIFKSVGEFGTFQKLLLLGMATFPCFHNMQHAAWNFIAPHHPHWCKIDAIQSYPEAEQKYISVPYDDDTDDGYDMCHMFNLPWNNYTPSEYDNWNRSIMTEGVDTRKCNEWMYDDSFRATIISEVSIE